MKHISMRTFVALALTTGGGSLGVIAACSSASNAPASNDNGAHQIAMGSSGSNSSGSSGASTDMDAGTSGGGSDATLVTYDGPPPNVDGGVLSCATPSGLPIKFNPIYSGFDGTHTYQVPVFVDGLDPGSVVWGSSDPTMVHFDPYVRGIMITTMKAGDVTIVATSGGKCGSAPLHIAQYTIGQWDIGNARYNNSTPLMINPEAGISADASFGDASFDASSIDASAICDYLKDASIPNVLMGETPACTNCHGATSSGKLFGMTLFSDIGHTPEQTGGFSEDDLTNAFYNATIPDGGTYDQAIVPYCIWHQIHLWRDIDTPEKQAGMRAYLRSLTPQEQTGCFELFHLNACAGDGG